MGKALIDAYRLCESLQFIGICVDDHTASIIKRTKLAKNIHGKQSVQRKSGQIKEKNKIVNTDLNIINVWNIYKNNFLKKDFSVEEFFQAFEPNFGPFDKLSKDVQLKYRNTVQLIKNTYN